VEDLEVVSEWVASGIAPGLVLDAKVVPTLVAEWLEEAFRGHACHAVRWRGEN
jgi:hypothetical protein